MSPYTALVAANVGGSVTLTPGLPSVLSNDTSGFAAAVAAASAADLVVLALGLDGTVEAEARDRVSIDLPAAQHALAAAVAGAGKPTALVLLHGGSVDISAELASPAIGAVLDAFYPGFLGGSVIAATLLGDNDHLGGKLPTTVYPAAYTGLIAMSEMELDVGVGRGYRYYTGTPVLPFGFGLAYTTFSFAPVNAAAFRAATALRTGDGAALAAYTVNVTNIGAATGDTVVQQFFSPGREAARRAGSRLLRQLIGYQRVHLAPGESALVALDVPARALGLRDRASGDLLSVPGEYAVVFEDGAGARLDAAVVLEGDLVTLERFAMRAE